MAYWSARNSSSHNLTKPNLTYPIHVTTSHCIVQYDPTYCISEGVTRCWGRTSLARHSQHDPKVSVRPLLTHPIVISPHTLSHTNYYNFPPWSMQYPHPTLTYFTITHFCSTHFSHPNSLCPTQICHPYLTPLYPTSPHFAPPRYVIPTERATSAAVITAACYLGALLSNLYAPMVISSMGWQGNYPPLFLSFSPSFSLPPFLSLSLTFSLPLAWEGNLPGWQDIFYTDHTLTLSQSNLTLSQP